jgi:hypothetical protein
MHADDTQDNDMEGKPQQKYYTEETPRLYDKQSQLESYWSWLSLEAVNVLKVELQVRNPT